MFGHKLRHESVAQLRTTSPQSALSGAIDFAAVRDAEAWLMPYPHILADDVRADQPVRLRRALSAGCEWGCCKQSGYG